MNDTSETFSRLLREAFCPEITLRPWQVAAVVFNASAATAGSSERLRTGKVTPEQLRGVLARFRREIASAGGGGTRTDWIAAANSAHNSFERIVPNSGFTICVSRTWVL